MGGSTKRDNGEGTIAGTKILIEERGSDVAHRSKGWYCTENDTKRSKEAENLGF